MKRQLATVTTPICAAILIAGYWFARAGDVNPPPGPIGDTYPTLGFKTLQQVEPRTPVDKLPGSPTAQFVIRQPGSYYLTGNVAGVNGKNGIEISADQVTLDLNGFALLGLPIARAAIVATDPTPAQPARRGIAVVNGTVRSWPQGGVDLQNAEQCRVEGVVALDCQFGVRTSSNSLISDCSAEFCSNTGIQVFDNSSIRHCTAMFCGNAGFTLNSGCSITGCTSQRNNASGFEGNSANTFADCVARENGNGKTHGDGYQLVEDCSLENCLAIGNGSAGCAALHRLKATGCNFSNNRSSGIDAFDDDEVTDCNASLNGGIGIYLNGGTVTNCTAERNTFAGISSFADAMNVVHCNASHNGGAGVVLDGGGRVEGCTANKNFGDGIVIIGTAQVLANHCQSNGSFAGIGGNGAGIHVALGGGTSVIDGNHVAANDRGIEVSSTRHTIIRNIATGNTNNFPIIAGNDVGPITSVSLVTNPLSNISY